MFTSIYDMSKRIYFAFSVLIQRIQFLPGNPWKSSTTKLLNPVLICDSQYKYFSFKSKLSFYNFVLISGEMNSLYLWFCYLPRTP